MIQVSVRVSLNLLQRYHYRDAVEAVVGDIDFHSKKNTFQFVENELHVFVQSWDLDHDGVEFNSRISRRGTTAKQAQQLRSKKKIRGTHQG